MNNQQTGQLIPERIPELVDEQLETFYNPVARP